MKDSSIIIKLDNHFIYLNMTEGIPYPKSNLPQEYFKFKSHQAILWKAKQVSYHEPTGTLTIEIIDYCVTDLSGFKEQKPKHPIHSIKFEKLDWQAFHPLLYSYTLSKLKPVLYNINIQPVSEISAYAGRVKIPETFSPAEKQQTIERTHEIIVKYEDATFEDNQICFNAYLRTYNVSLKFTIHNPHLKKNLKT